MIDPNTAQRFQAMAAPHLDAAYNLARWLTRNPADADDVVQDAYLRAFRYFDGFRGGDGRAWLLAIVRNTCYSWLRRNRSEQATMEYDDEIASLQSMSDPAELAMHVSDPAQLLLRASNQQQLEAALLQLPTEQREILVLRELEDLSYKEIAGITGLPIGTVMSRLSRARLQLRRCFEAMSTTS
ncbi:MAG: polymerase sigma factor [Nevskia sp.]|nr:polymerase sigma factor [Nevskia sp.]